MLGAEFNVVIRRDEFTGTAIAPKLLHNSYLSHSVQPGECNTVSDPSDSATLQRIRRFVDSLCGIYSRVARRMGVDRTYVSRVARGERHSPEVERALIQDFERIQQNDPEKS